jgi:UDP-3-O-[3-hydroxymyristoyl] glucosamine N-acyltransferase
MQLPTAISVHDIADYLQAQVIMGKHAHITGINEIHKVQHGDLSFVDHPKYYAKALHSAATVVLINTTQVDNPQQKTLLYSQAPFNDYNKLVSKYSPLENTFMPSVRSQTARIGENTQIMAGAVIGEQVRIGKNCLIYPNVVIYNNTEIGDNVVIHANSVIGADAYYFQKQGEKGYVKMRTCGRVLIHDNVEIGAACTIDKGVSGDTIIGEGTKLDNQVHIGHGVVIGKHCLLAAQVGVAGKTHIGNHVILWGQVGVSKSLYIGDGAVVYAQSGVPKSIAGGKTYFGSPVQEARAKMKEMAIIKHLPKIWNKLKRL